MALAIDQALGVLVKGTSATTAAFTTTATNEIIVAVVAGGWEQSSPPTYNSTVTGTGLSWTLAKRSNGQTGQFAEVWWALASGIRTSQTVTATASNTGFFTSWALYVVTFTGANTGAPIGATAAVTHASGTSVNPSATLTTTAGSYCVAAGADFSSAVTLAAGSGQSLLNDQHDTTDGVEAWTQRTNGVTTGTSQTMNNTGLGTDQWDFVAVEILAAASSDPFPLIYCVPRQLLATGAFCN